MESALVVALLLMDPGVLVQQLITNTIDGQLAAQDGSYMFLP